MINRFQIYIENGKVKRKTPDPEEASALLKKAIRRLRFIRSIAQNSENYDYVFEEAYESFREASQSIMSRQGFKPYSHEATISFLKEYHSSEFPDYVVEKLDRMRQLRDDAVYRAVRIEKNDTEEMIKIAASVISKIKNI